MVKVLHIIESFDGQAIEKWLSILTAEAKISSISLDWTFYCIQSNAGRYSNIITEREFKIKCSPYNLTKPIKFLISLRKFIQEEKFDIIHSHHDIMSAFYYLSSIGLRIKKITHIHNTSLSLPTNNSFKLLILLPIFKCLTYILSNKIICVSENVYIKVINKFNRNKLVTIHCGIFSLHNNNSFDNYSVRKFYNIPKSSLLILFVGRMIPYKNPLYVLNIFNVIYNYDKDVYCMFVGEGPYKIYIQNIINTLNIGKNVKCLGWNSNVYPIMKEADVLIFPSEETPPEGLGLTVIEAQSVGLPVVMSLSVPNEAIIFPELVARIPLDKGETYWANQIFTLLKSKDSNSLKYYSDRMMKSSFSSVNCLTKILNIYRVLTSNNK